MGTLDYPALGQWEAFILGHVTVIRIIGIDDQGELYLYKQ